MTEAIARELKALRVRQGLTLEEVAKMRNVSYETMRKYETGKTNITVEFIEEMLKIYKTSLSIFFENVCANMHEDD